jgi:predicted nicotinamide N-methyase
VNGGVALTAVRRSLAERLAELRGVPEEALPPALLDLRVRRVALPGRDAFLVQPRDWEELRQQEGAASRPVPFWATLWPSGLTLARRLAADPPPRGARVLELGCGLGLPSIVAARAGARVLATDGSGDAAAFAAHGLALNELVGDVAVADWGDDGDALVRRGPWDLVLAADVLYTATGVDDALRLLPRLVGREGEVRIADPDRSGARHFLAAARATFRLRTDHVGEIALHRLRPK